MSINGTRGLDVKRFSGIPAVCSRLVRSVFGVSMIAGMLAIAGCGGDDPSDRSITPAVSGDYQVTSQVTYNGTSDDLVTSGYGIASIKATVPTTAYADPLAPTAAEIRRNLVMKTVASTAGTWTNFYGPNIDPATELPIANDGKVAGDELVANLNMGTNDVGDPVVSSVVLQIPTTFSPAAGCLLAVSTGGTSHFWSEQTVAQWALLKGCAVVISEKSTGPSIHDLAAGVIVRPDGTTASASPGTPSRFTASLSNAGIGSYLASLPNRLAYKWAHSRWNPEEKAGDAMLRAIRFARAELAKRTYSGNRTFDASRLTTIAYGQSGGGGAVVMAAELDTEGLITGIVANAPQTQTRANPALTTVFDGRAMSGTARTLDDYFSLSTLWQPCAYVALHPDTTNASAINRCAALKKAGLVQSTTLAGQAAEAIATTRANGWADWDSTGFGDLYTYGLVSQYGHFGVEDRLCNYSIAAVDGNGSPIALTAAQRAAMAVTYSSGKPSFAYSAAANVVLVNDADPRGPRTSASSISPSSGLADGNFDGALCMRNLVTGNSAAAARVKAGVDALLVNGNLRGKPTIVIQGRSDTTLPVDFTVRPYVALNSVREGTASRLAYIELTNMDHTVDALYTIRSLEAMRATLANGAALPPSQVLRPVVSTKTYPKWVAQPVAADRITASAGVLTIPR